MPADPPPTTRAERRGAAVFGVFALALAGWLLVLARDERHLGPLAVAVVLAALGADGVLAAVRGRRSLASRIGPLP